MFPLIQNCWKFLSWMSSNFKNSFSVTVEMIMFFWLCSVFMINYNDWFSNVKPTLHSQNKLYLVRFIILFIYCCIPFSQSTYMLFKTNSMTFRKITQFIYCKKLSLCSVYCEKYERSYDSLLRGVYGLTTLKKEYYMIDFIVCYRHTNLRVCAV